MGQYIRVNGLRNLKRALDRGAKQIQKQCDAAIWSTAKKAVRPIRKRAPLAFGELRNSVEAYPRGVNGNPVTSVDAPHASAVEIGSPPHTPDFDKLLAWVKLRGMQALNKRGSLRKRIPAALGFTSKYQVPRVGKLIKALEVKGKRGRNGNGRYLPADAAEQVARAISKGIEKHGTKPHWFVRESLEDIRQILHEEMKSAKDRVVGGPAMRVTEKDLI